jgi:hypothetical protein
MSSTGNFTPDYITHTYKVTNELKKLYGLRNSQPQRQCKSINILRIEQFPGKSQTTRVDDYLRLRTDPKSWTR